MKIEPNSPHTSNIEAMGEVRTQIYLANKKVKAGVLLFYFFVKFRFNNP